MKFFAAVAAAVSLVEAAIAATTGPYEAYYTTSLTLRDHTIYRPRTLPNQALPILVWGNGGCLKRGTMFEKALTEIASHGYIVIANGGTGFSLGQTDSDMLIESFNWIERNAQTGTYAGKIDPSKIVVAGQSCGGLEAVEVSNDPRIIATGVFNSGLLNPTRDGAWLQRLTKPIFYFLGGPDDIAYPNGERDYTNLPSGLPAWKGNLNVGHEATWSEVNGGEFGNIAVKWLNWITKGDTAGRDYLMGGGAAAKGWSIVHKNLQ
ncbi:hypothetical protein EX30DRAFT_342727 [Ascodesmis nigricans]|uniref:Alpha/beta-hydrolase n=1 Tax=Ascodesmis nigricans TaxID=341454 RepID=A0A4V3SI75_9PEZI|nr:hypothetical protein EX30DRAFT_342727 [Ascodesmis nigricans]